MPRNQQRNQESDQDQKVDVEPVEPTSDEKVENVEPTSADVESDQVVEPVDQKPVLVDALRAAWIAAATSENATATGGAQVLDVDLASALVAYRALAPTFTKNERSALVATLCADLSSKFLADGNMSAAMGTFVVRTKLDEATVKVAVVVDERRETAVKFAALSALVTLWDVDDETAALAGQIPADDPGLVSTFDKLVAILTKKSATKSTGGGSTSERAQARTSAEIDAAIAQGVTSDPMSYSKLAKVVGVSGGALLNIWESVDQGKRSIAGVKAVMSDGKKAFVLAV